MPKQVAIRLEGGLGDHILGMRLLHFIKRRYPRHSLVVYSDCGGFSSQLQVASMSPLVDEVVPVFQDPCKVTAENLGSLDNIQDVDLAKMRRAEVFIDAWPDPVCIPSSQTLNPAFLYIPQSAALGAPYYRILASRPKLEIPRESQAEAAAYIDFSGQNRCVAFNFDKLGSVGLCAQFHWLKPFMLQLLEDTRVTLLNIYSTRMDFPHYPEGLRLRRRAEVARTCQALSEMCTWHPRIVPMIDSHQRPLSIQTLAGILKKCRYFLGVDNGLKHLAWALHVPRTFFFPRLPHTYLILRWMPDFHRLVLLDSIETEWPSLLGRIRRRLL